LKFGSYFGCRGHWTSPAEKNAIHAGGPFEMIVEAKTFEADAYIDMAVAEVSH
jgi:hypothetical protein